MVVQVASYYNNSPSCKSVFIKADTDGSKNLDGVTTSTLTYLYIIHRR